MVIDREAIAARLRRLDECVAELRQLRPGILTQALTDLEEFARHVQAWLDGKA